MGTKYNPGEFDCYNKLKPDEPYFILMARDQQAPHRVLDWAQNREYGLGRIENPQERAREVAKIAEARTCAEAMKAWRQKNRSP